MSPTAHAGWDSDGLGPDCMVSSCGTDSAEGRAIGVRGGSGAVGTCGGCDFGIGSWTVNSMPSVGLNFSACRLVSLVSIRFPRLSGSFSSQLSGSFFQAGKVL